MLPAVDVFQEDIEKRYEQVEHQETADKVAGMESFKRPECPHELERRQSLMACDTEYAVDYYGIEGYLYVKFQQFMPREIGFAHEISCDHQETVYSRLAPCPENCHRRGGWRQGCLLQERPEVGVHNVMMRHNHQHHDYAV